MTGDTRLALLVPAYNAEAFLPRLFKSVAAQTVPFDEILVYDDCSTDGTAATAESLGARIVRGDVNRGCSFGKTALLHETSCGWVHFHDADDLIDPGFVEIARQWIAQDSADVVAFGCDERWDDTDESIGTNIPDDAALARDPAGYTITHKINAISGLYRREAVLRAGGFDLDAAVLYNEDQAFHAQLARAGLRFRADARVMMVNLRRRGSMSTANQARCIRARYHVLLKTLAGHGGAQHKADIARELWLTAAGAASHLDWSTADRAAGLAMTLASPGAAPPGKLFRTLCRASPRFALRFREIMIRLLKPGLRDGYPRWTMIGPSS